MAKNKKKLTKQERQLRQLQREQLHKLAKEKLIKSIEAHSYNVGDLVKVNGKLGVIAEYEPNILNCGFSIGREAFIRAREDFYSCAVQLHEREYFGDDGLEEQCIAVHKGLQAEKAQPLLSNIDYPAYLRKEGSDFYVGKKTILFDTEKKQYVVFHTIFKDLTTLCKWFGTKFSPDFTESEDGGIIQQVLDQAYAIKQNKSNNKGFYKVLYGGEMLGQKGKQQVWVAPCNIEVM